jgi:hypothetical protein
MIRDGIRIEFRARQPLEDAWPGISGKPAAMMPAGGFAYYAKGMMLSDRDRVPGGKTGGDGK